MFNREVILVIATSYLGITRWDFYNELEILYSLRFIAKTEIAVLRSRY